MSRRQITAIVDRHEGTFIIAHRDYSDLGRIYHKPSDSSMARLAEALQNMLNRKTVRIQQTCKSPLVYLYTPTRKSL